MESCIIRAIRKLQAAEYHCTNIRSEIRELESTARKAARSFKRRPRKMFVRGEKDNVAYELDAFLAAARSSIDFVSAMLALHVEGMNRRTGSSTLLKRVETDSTAPFGALLTKWQEWIGEVKEYRDEHVHYRTIYMSGGFEIEWRGRKKVVTIVPALVPEKFCLINRPPAQEEM